MRITAPNSLMPLAQHIIEPVMILLLFKGNMILMKIFLSFAPKLEATLKRCGFMLLNPSLVVLM